MLAVEPYPERFEGAWRAFLGRERGRVAPETFKGIVRHLERFFGYCRGRRLEGLTEAELIAFSKGLGLGVGSVRAHLSAVRHWLRFLYDEGLELSASYLMIPSWKGRCGSRLPLSIEEIESWFELCDLGCPLGLRDRALFELAYGSGLRRGELLRLELGHLDVGGSQLRVGRAKNGYGREVAMTGRACGYLCLYLEKGRPKFANRHSGELLFLSSRGCGLTRSEVKGRVSYYRRRLAVGSKLGLHVLRHSFGAHLVRGGAEVGCVAELLGHRSLASTALYTQVKAQDLERLRRHHPRGYCQARE